MTQAIGRSRLRRAVVLHVTRYHGGLDYLRDPDATQLFERGFALLAKHKLSFDLQCCPAQASRARGGAAPEASGPQHA